MGFFIASFIFFYGVSKATTTKGNKQKKWEFFFLALYARLNCAIE